MLEGVRPGVRPAGRQRRLETRPVSTQVGRFDTGCNTAPSDDNLDLLVGDYS